MSNNLGNQMFMYASAYAFAKKLGRELLIDDETAYQDQRNIYRYDLDIFNGKLIVSTDNGVLLGDYNYSLHIPSSWEILYENHSNQAMKR